MTEHCYGLPVLVIDGARFSDFEGFTRESTSASTIGTHRADSLPVKSVGRV